MKFKSNQTPRATSKLASIGRIILVTAFGASTSFALISTEGRNDQNVAEGRGLQIGQVHEIKMRSAYRGITTSQTDGWIWNLEDEPYSLQLPIGVNIQKTE